MMSLEEIPGRIFQTSPRVIMSQEIALDFLFRADLQLSTECIKVDFVDKHTASLPFNLSQQRSLQK
jgi:hypothetical protein